MQIIKGDRSYSKLIIRKNFIEKYLLTSLLLMFAAISFIYYFQKFEIPDSESFIILFSMILGMLMSLFFVWIFGILNKFLDKKDNNISKAKLGDDGEREVLNKLEKCLDGNYYVYPNFKIPGRKFDVDFLIIGRKGIIAMEVKNSSSLFTFSEKEALRIKGRGYTQEITKLVGNADPRIKLKNHCKSLNYYLYSIGLRSVKARKVLVFVNSSIKIEGKSGIYIVKKLDELGQYFESLSDDERFSVEYCTRIIKKINNSLKKKS